jgi:4-amino-4-deoxy-L-arabinose transferase-like glycosyltransferase
MRRVGWISRAAIISHWALILTVATALRIRDLDRYSLWYDEVVTMRLARTATPAELIALLGQIDGTRAPLHPLLLQGWLRLFGTTELAARSFSSVCGILTVAVVYVLGRRLFDERTGRWAAWFATVCPPLVYYSQEARMYAWLVLLTCLSWLVFLGFRKSAGWRTKVLYGLSLTALVYSHPLGLFMVAAHGLAYLLVRRSLALGLRSWLAVLAAVALAIAPWLPQYLDHGTDYPMPRYSLRFLLAVPIEYVGGNGAVLLACLTIIGLGLVFFEHRRPVLTHVTENLILLSWMILPPVTMFAYSRVGRPIFGPPRYHLFIAPAYLILLARGLCRLPVLPRLGLAAGAFALSLSAIDANVYSQVVKADWRGLAGWLDRGGAAELAGPGREPITVVVHPSDPRFPRDQVEAARYYLDPRYRVVLDGAGSRSGEAVLEVDCLSAEQVREGDNVPGFYGLVIRRR